MKPRRLALVACLLAGALCFGQGAYILVKAQVAQLLLARAWQARQAGATDARPWPWADTQPVARLRAPAQGVDLFVLEGASGRTMAFGPGHLENSAPPGTAGNTILAAHRDTHFAFLKDLRPGEALELETPDGVRHHYRASAGLIRDFRATDLLRAEPVGTLTLITCYPFDAVVPGGPLRFVVRAYEVEDAVGFSAPRGADPAPAPS